MIERLTRESEAQKAATAREEELRRAEEAKRLAEAKRAEEQHKLDQVKRQQELAKAKAEAERALEAARVADTERQAALRAAKEARAEAKRQEEQRRTAEQALKIAEAERQAALKAEMEARGKAEAAKAEAVAATKQAQSLKIVSIPTPKSSEPSSQAPGDPAVLVRAVQTELKRVGCGPGPIDGKWGSGSQEALKQFIRLGKLNLAAEPSEAVLNALAMQKRRICPPQSVASEEGTTPPSISKPPAAGTKSGIVHGL
jgi:hypothetical protein